MEETLERNLGDQPIALKMKEHGLTNHDLVNASTEQITHKMVAKACKGRRLTKNVQNKVVRSMNLASGQNYKKQDLFNY